MFDSWQEQEFSRRCHVLVEGAHPVVHGMSTGRVPWGEVARAWSRPLTPKCQDSECANLTSTFLTRHTGFILDSNNQKRSCNFQSVPIITISIFLRRSVRLFPLLVNETWFIITFRYCYRRLTATYLQHSSFFLLWTLLLCEVLRMLTYRFQFICALLRRSLSRMWLIVVQKL
jgi:hypothetical protein